MAVAGSGRAVMITSPIALIRQRLVKANRCDKGWSGLNGVFAS